jgi:hypothetical protein
VPLFPIEPSSAVADGETPREFVWYYPELIAELRAALEKSVGSEGSVPSGK